jgi:DNA-directed RNA polymerase specialized sigma24 family protein
MAQFPSTQWSLIRQAGASASGRSAFGELARAYRGAILAFFRARLSVDAADDATQSFLALSFEHAWWSRADAAMGTFRGFLLLLLRRHLGHLREQHPGTDDAAAAETVADDAPEADRQFDLRFALALTQRALDAQRTRYRERARGELFEQLLPLLSSPPEHGELKRIAQTLGVPANSLTVELQRLRQRLREAMRELVRDLCIDEATFAAEWAAVQRILDGG